MRLKSNDKGNANLYPTHGFGPISPILNFHRGDMNTPSPKKVGELARNMMKSRMIR